MKRHFREWSRFSPSAPYLLPPTPYLLLFFFLFVLAGCAGGQKRETSLIWPSPPEPARIKFIRTISAATDVEPPSFLDRFKAVLFGAAPTISLAKPYGVFASPDGRIYVADTGWRRILVFDFTASRFFMIGVDGPGALSKPLGVAADRSGRVYVTDTDLHRCLIYDHDGAFLFAIGDINRFEQPVGVGVNDDLRRVYISDTRRHKISVYDFEGNFLFEFGKRGTGDGEFNYPANLFVDRQGKVYVTDLNFRVQIFDADGKFLSKFGSVGTGFGQFSMPKGVGVDSQGHIYVVDARFSNVQIFDPQGRLLLFFGELGSRLGEFYLPAGLYVDGQDRIYVADQYNKRIDVFQYIGPKEPTAGTQENNTEREG
jgi:DNA-binding beta-propeller fold protein YncE